MKKVIVRLGKCWAALVQSRIVSYPEVNSTYIFFCFKKIIIKKSRSWMNAGGSWSAEDLRVVLQ